MSDISDDVRIAVVVLADTETHADLGRAVNALETAKELHEAGETVTVIFDGAGTKWIGELANPDHRLHRSFESLRDVISGACRYCATAFGATEGVHAAGIALLGEYEGHPSIRNLVIQGYQVITF